MAWLERHNGYHQMVEKVPGIVVGCIPDTLKIFQALFHLIVFHEICFKKSSEPRTRLQPHISGSFVQK